MTIEEASVSPESGSGPSDLGAMPTLVVGMFVRETLRMPTQAWAWHPRFLKP